MNGLQVAKTGIVYLNITGFPSLPCSALLYSMAVNSVHSCIVDVATGISIKQGNVQGFDANDLLLSLHDPAKKTSGLIECSLTEDREGYESPVLIFRGFITAAMPTYKAGFPSASSIRFNCLGPGALLFSQPGLSYIDTTFSHVLNRLDGGSEINFNTAWDSGDNWQLQLSDVYEAAVDLCAQESISSKVSICVDCAKKAATLVDKKDYTKEGDAAVSAVLGGNTRLNLSQDAEEGYSAALFMQIANGMKSTNLLGAIQNTLCSDDFMLQLVPRWSVDTENDFKLDVAPCLAWSPYGTCIYLTPDDVISIQASYTALDAFNTPDVLLVNFSEAYSYLYGTPDNSSVGLFGVACLDPELQATLGNYLVLGLLDEALDQAAGMRVREIRAPSWIVFDMCDATSTTCDAVDRNNTEGLEGAEKTPESITQEKQRHPAPQITHDAEIVHTANKIAQTLFFNYYLANDTVIVEVHPGLRFGGDPAKFFEQNLGNTVEIDLTHDRVTHSGIHIKGELKEINYNITLGETSSAAYTLTLARVRHVDTNVPVGECPIYTRVYA